MGSHDPHMNGAQTKGNDVLPKTNMEPTSKGLQHDVPFPTGDFQGPCVVVYDRQSHCGFDVGMQYTGCYKNPHQGGDNISQYRSMIKPSQVQDFQSLE